jgi:hypothetical protein
MAARLATCIVAMRVHVRTNGGMMLTRTATPARLRSIASEFTGKSYPRSRKGLVTALADLEALRDSFHAEAVGV